MMNQKDLINELERAAQGDEAALTALYNLTYRDMYHLALYLSRSAEAAEDILQESYINAFSHLDDLREPERFLPWLKRIVINEWHEHGRLHRADNLRADDAMADEWDVMAAAVKADQSDLVQADLEKREEYAEIRHQVNLLPEKQRVCIVLFYFEEMTIEEIADALKIPEDSVKSRLHYGRDKLRRALKNDSLFSDRGQFSQLLPGVSGGNPSLLGRILGALSSGSESAVAAAASRTVGGGLLLKLGAGLLSLTAAASAVGLVWHKPARPIDTESPPVPTVVTTTTTAAVITTTTTAATTVTTATTTTATSAIATTAAPVKTATFDYRTVEGGMSVTQYTGDEENVSVPSETDGIPVVSVDDGAFENRLMLRSVSLPSSVTSVGNNAFRGCKNLSGLSLGSGVRQIGSAAFMDCDAVTSLTVPSNVRRIGIYAFAYCDALNDVNISEGVTLINYNAFCGCGNLRSVILPSSVEVIGSDAFAGTSPELTLGVTEGSYAHQYAIDNDYPFYFI